MILSKYLAKETIKTQSAILFILLIIFIAQQLVRVLGSAVSGNVPVDLVVPLLALGMPTMAQLMLPLSLFIAVLLTFGRLYVESEITVMRACGIGQSLLVKVTLFLSLITALLAGYNALWLTPWALNKQIEIVSNAKANPGMAALTAGQFISTNNGEFVLFIENIKNNSIENVYLFQTRERNNLKPSVVTAKEGVLQELNNGYQMLNLTQGSRFEGSAALPEFKLTHFDQYQAFVGFKPSQNDNDDIALMSLSELIQHNSPQTRAELQWRLSLILAVPLMALLAVPLSKVNPRQGRFAKILPALLLYLIYFLLQSSLKSAGINGKFNSEYLMIATNFAFLILAYFLLHQENRFLDKINQKFTALGRRKG